MIKKTICLILAGLVALAFVAAPVCSSPAVTSMTVSSYLQKVGSGVSVTCTFSDYDASMAHTAYLDWEDGTVSTVLLAAGQTSVTATHAYNAPGVFRIGVRIADSNGEEDMLYAPQAVIVYDPDGGFTTGGGWLGYSTGPALSMAAETTAAAVSTDSRASFAFVCNYRKGSTVPAGNTEIHAEGMNFHSSAYEWMVVSGARAQFKGTGTIDGQEGYSFLITVIDGTVAGSGMDLIRIKIWNTEEGYTVLDNEPWSWDHEDPYTPTNGGSIVVHTR